MARFSISWRDGRYFVNRPHYNGGEVIDAADVDALVKLAEAVVCEFTGSKHGSYERRLLDQASLALAPVGKLQP